MKVTIERIESLVSSCYFANAAHAATSEIMTAQQAIDSKHLETTTLCFLVLKSGFTVVGKSACADPSEFDQVKGEKFAREDAIRQIWALEGYLLKQSLAKTPSPQQSFEEALIELREKAKDGSGKRVLLGAPDLFASSQIKAVRNFAARVADPNSVVLSMDDTVTAGDCWAAEFDNLALLCKVAAAAIRYEKEPQT